MRAVDQVTSATILLADYVSIDGAGKLNIVGGGISRIQSGPDGMTAPFAVLAILEFNPEFDGHKFQFALELIDGAGQLVNLEGPEGKSRIQIFQEMTAGIDPNSPEIARRQGVPPGVIPVGIRSVVNLSTGLPLVPNNFYAWRMTVDSEESSAQWKALFYVGGQEQLVS